MNSSRRKFLRMSSMMGLATVVTGNFASVAFSQHDKREWLGTGLGFRIPKAALKDPLSQISRQMFERCIDTKFTFSSLQGKQSATMMLTAVEDFQKLNSDPTSADPNNCFLIIFSGPASPALSQNTYSVQNQWLGRFELFIVPGASTSKSRDYGAVINRL
jgi:hypothetical protein